MSTFNKNSYNQQWLILEIRRPLSMLTAAIKAAITIMMSTREIKLYLEYYRGIFLLNAPLSLMLLFFRFKLVPILIFFCTLGFALILAYYKMFRNQDYYYYHNCGITKVQLIVATTCINLVVSIIIYLAVLWFID